MASERTSRPQGVGLPGPRDSARPPEGGGDGPSPAEVRRRVSSLYDRAEAETGNYNATRAMRASGGRQRPEPPSRDASAGSDPGSGAGSDPALDAVAGRWFDAARARFGPSVAAALPPDRLPRPGAARTAGGPHGAADRPSGEAGLARLDAGPTRREPAAAPDDAPTAARRAELPSAPAVRALPAAPVRAAAAAAAVDPGTPSGARPAFRSAGAVGPVGHGTETDGRGTAGPSAGGPAGPGAASEATEVVSALHDGWSGTAPATDDLSTSDQVFGDPVLGRLGFAGLGFAGPGLAGPGLPDSGLPDSGLPDSGLPDPGFVGPGYGGPGYGGPAFGVGGETAGRVSSARGPVFAGPVTGAAGPDTFPGALPAQPTAPAPAGPWPAALGRFRRPVSEAPKERSRHKLLQARALLARQVAPPAPFDVPPPQPGPTPAAREPWPAADSDPATAMATVSGSGSGSGSVEAIAPDARSAYARKAARALGFARAQIGRPCLRGGGGPDSYDCSGLTRAAWRTAGVTLPRTAHEQAGCGTAVPLAELRPGDLVFFHADAGHVGLYAGDGTVVHAPGPGAAVREESVFFAGARAVHSARRPA